MSEPATPAAVPLRILLVDDHTLFREGLSRMLDSNPAMQMSADFATAAEAIEAVRAGLPFDVALLDYELAIGADKPTGLDLMKSLRELRPAVPVLIVTAGMQLPELLRAVQEMGAGIFLKTEPIAELMLAIQRTARGERWISSGAALELLAKPSAPRSREQITDRESYVLRGVLEGLTNKEIGVRLDLSESAVKAVLQKLFEKTGVRSRSQLVRYAIEAERGGG